MGDQLIVLVTCPTAEESANIAEALVAERLAACVNIVGGIESVYRWEEQVTRDREVLMVIKTNEERYDELENRVKELHSYENPEVVALKVDRGSSQYLDWLRDAVTRQAP
jgi:periplasmic divalent cation tolerance protein